MKASTNIRSAIAVSLPFVFAVTMIGCGGDDGGGNRVNNSTLNQIPRDDFSLIQPAPESRDVCTNPTIYVKLSNRSLGSNTNVCNNSQSAANLIKIIERGNTSNAVSISHVLPFQRSDSCDLEVTSSSLQPGTSYYVCAFNNGSIGREVYENCYTFTTANPEKICSGGTSFFVTNIAGKSASPVAFGRESAISDGDLPFEEADLDAVGNLAWNSLLNMIGLGFLTGGWIQSEPIPVEFNQAVDPNSIRNAVRVVKFDAASIGDQNTSDVVTGTTITTDPRDPRTLLIQLPSYSMDPGTYMVWVNRTVRSSTGLRLTSSRYSGTVSYIGAINIKGSFFGFGYGYQP